MSTTRSCLYATFSATLITITITAAPALSASPTKPHEQPRAADKMFMPVNSIYMDFATALSNLNVLGPELLSGQVKFAKQKCAALGLDDLSKMRLEVAAAALSKAPNRSFCLFPLFFRLSQEMTTQIEVGSAPIISTKPFNPLLLRIGWWNLRLFFTAQPNDSSPGITEPTDTGDELTYESPAEWLYRWVLVSEGLNRSFAELMTDSASLVSMRPQQTSRPLLQPLVKAHLEHAPKLSQLRVFLENSHCSKGNLPCQNTRQELFATYQEIIATRGQYIQKLNRILNHPVAGTEVIESELVRDALQTARALKKLRAAHRSSLEIANELVKGTISEPDHLPQTPTLKGYAALLAEMGSLPKSLTQEQLSLALQAGLLLESLEDVLTTEINPSNTATKITISGNHADSLKNLKNILGLELDEYLSSLSDLLYQRDQESPR